MRGASPILAPAVVAAGVLTCAALMAACAEEPDFVLDNPTDPQSPTWVGHEVLDPADPFNFPTVEITDAPTRVVINVPHTFIATASDPNQRGLDAGRIACFDWDFGDGTLVPDGGESVQHSYTTEGEYSVRCAVTDDDGNVASAQANVRASDLSLTTWSTGAGMPTARSRLAAAALGGKLYVVGGYDGSSRLRALEVYDPATDSWATGPDMFFYCYGLAAAAIDGNLYVVGGFNGSPSHTLEIYDPATNSWALGPGMPTARYGLAVAEVDGKLYAVGGNNSSGGYLGNLDIYNAAMDRWTRGSDMPTARSDLAVAEVDGKLYAMGGFGSSGYVRTLEVYDPATNTWTAGPDMPTARRHLAASAID